MRSTLFMLALLLALPLTTSAQIINEHDIDGDGILNEDEDKNSNGIVDPDETDPSDADTDGGGEADGKELLEGRDPLNRTDDYTYDLDGDGLTNGQEAALGTNSAKADSDGDGVNDKDDLFPLDPEYTIDTDADGLPDEYEVEHNLQPDVRSDAREDKDQDGLSNVEEFIQGTDIESPDTDEDGELDGEEVEDGTDPLENPCLVTAAPTEVLHDIEHHWSKQYVTVLQQTKITEDGPRIVEGYWTSDGAIFRPDQEISRFELLKLVLLGSCITPREYTGSGSFAFTDVRNISRPYDSEDTILKRQTIYTAFHRGIIDGYPDKSFQPDEPVNRAEALKIIFEASKLKPFDDVSYVGIFSDVDPSDWFSPYVENALSYAFIEGYADGTFRPGQPITRAEAAKIVLYMMISNPHVNGYVIPTEGLDV